MDNMKYYNDSLAYDFERFMPKTAKAPAEIVKMPDPSSRKRSRRAVKAMSVSAFAVMTAVFVLAALCTNIGLRLEINEANDRINGIKNEISMLDSELTELEVEFDRRISYANIELAATELGMAKRNKEQVKYIRVNNTDSAKLSGGEIAKAEE